jgi:hypothetical protein
MLAFVYLAVATYLGDFLCRRFYRFISLPHRWAAAFLIGILLSTWCTYPLAIAFAFADTAQPLAWANLFYFLIVLLILFSARPVPDVDPVARATKLNWRDAPFLAAFVAISCWLMFSTLTMRDGDVRVTSVAWNDFGPNLALMQSFALGHNFPLNIRTSSANRSGIISCSGFRLAISNFSASVSLVRSIFSARSRCSRC